MKVDFSLERTEFTDDEVEHFIKNLGIDKGSLTQAISDIAKTAFMEYKEMICNTGIADKAEEVRQKRLEFLVKYYYKNRLPKESEIQTTFQLSSTASKTLLKNTRSKKRTGLEEQINNSVKVVLQGAKLVKDKYRIEIKSNNVLQELNEVISEKGPGLYKVQAVRGIASLYECPKETMDLLKSEYGL